MNYRHHFHAGNHADVLKHVLLVRLLRALQRKEAGLLYLETHAGRGAYALDAAASGDSLARRPEHPDGIGRLWPRTDPPEAVADYLALVRAFDGGAGAAPRRYPGSPRLARLLARPQDRLALCERHPEEFEALRAEFAGEPRVSLHLRDGYEAPAAFLPPPERRALVLVDPPFEDEAEWDSVGAALEEGLRRFPSGVYAVWHPLTERAAPEFFLGRLRTLAAPALGVELDVGGDGPGLRGSGLIVLNPPWRIEDEVGPAVDFLAAALGREGRGRGAVRWLVPRR